MNKQSTPRGYTGADATGRKEMPVRGANPNKKKEKRIRHPIRGHHRHGDTPAWKITQERVRYCAEPGVSE